MSVREKTCVRGSDTNRDVHSPQKAGSSKYGSKKKRDCFICVAKSKSLNCYAVTVFAYEKLISHNLLKSSIIKSPEPAHKVSLEDDTRAGVRASIRSCVRPLTLSHINVSRVYLANCNHFLSEASLGWGYGALGLGRIKS